jgi:hypothetical protein
MVSFPLNHANYIERLERLDDRASHLSLPTWLRPLVYDLRSHIDDVRQKVEKHPAQVQQTPRKSLRPI